MSADCTTASAAAPPRIATRGWALTLFGLFALTGLSFSSWVTQTPAMRDSLQVSTGRMGVILLALALGSILGLIGASRFIASFGSKYAVLSGILTAAAGLLLVGVSDAFASEPTVLVGLAVFGVGNGLGDVGLNVEGSALERETGRTLLPALHASYSAGTLLGAGIGAGAIIVEASATVHLTGIAVLCAAVVAASIRFVPRGTGKEAVGEGVCGTVETPTEPGIPVWRDARLLLIGIVVLGMAFAEGSANDWLPLTMVDGYAMSPANAALVYAVFVATMMVARLAGGVVVDRYGRVPILRATATVGAVGLALVIADIAAAAAAVGVILWAIGASLGFPVGLSAAGDNPRNAAARVSAVSTVGYFAFLAGPPMLGFLGHEFGLLRAMSAVLVGVVLAGLFVPATRREVGK